MQLPNIPILNQVSFLEKVLFTKHLSVMIKSGIPLVEAISALRDQTPNQNFKKVLTDVIKDVSNGKSLEKAMAKYPKVFDPFYISIVSIGEESGNLESNLIYLADHMQKSYEFKKKVEGALLYPAIIVFTTIVVGRGISTFVLPQLVDLFKSLDVELPLSTRILLFVADIMKKYGLIITPGVILGFIFTYAILQTSRVRPWWHKTLLSLPIFGTLFENIELASICRNLGVMLKSGIPIAQSLNSLHDATSNLVYKSYVEKMQKSVDRGKKLSDEMSDPELKFIPTIVAKMVAVGEESGKLDETFIYLGDFFDGEVDNAAKNLSTVIEPFLLIVIGLGVAFVAIAIITPIYDLTSAIRK